MNLPSNLTKHTPEGVHKHKCASCGHVWQHDGAELKALKAKGIKERHFPTFLEYVRKQTASHKCPNCRDDAYDIFRTPEDTAELYTNFCRIFGKEHVTLNGTSVQVH
jgi:hypothetical protein